MANVPPSYPGVVRVDLGFNLGPANQKCGSHFYLTYHGGPPSNADCDGIATAISGVWGTDFASFLDANAVLLQVKVTDLSSDTAAQGVALVNVAGTAGANQPGLETCTLISFHINRRYRGGKPRIYLPIGTTASMVAGDFSWDSTYTAAVDAAWSTFMVAVLAVTVGSTVFDNHVSISLVQGVLEPTTLSSGRVKQDNKYRAASIPPDVITAHATSSIIAVQRRRRTSTTF